MNLITNGTFDTDLSGWSKIGNWVWNAGAAKITNDGSLSQSIPLLAGLQYTLTYDLTLTSGYCLPVLNDANGTIQNTSGTKTEIITAGAGTINPNKFSFKSPFSSGDFEVDNVTLELVVDIETTFQYPNKLNSWLAAHNPIIITAQRKDFEVTTTVDDGSSSVAKVKINTSATLPSDIEGYVYFNSGSLSGVYEVLSSGSNYVIIDLDWTTDTAGGWLNLNSTFDNFRIATAIYKRDTAGNYVLFGNMLSYADPKGSVTIDVTSFSSRSVTFKDDFAFNSEVDKDENICSALKFMHKIIYNVDTVISETEVPEDDVILFFANAAMQVGHEFDSNMVEFDRSISDDAQWLIAQQYTSKLTFWKGLPFEASIINTLGNIGYSIFNPDEINVVGSLATGVAQYVNRINIGKILTGIYSASIPEGNYRFDITNGVVDTRIFESLTIAVKNACKNPVYLKWISANGGWNYFMFEKKQTIFWNTATDGFFEKYIPALSAADGDSDFLNKKNIPGMLLGATGLDIDDMYLIMALLESPKVMRLTNMDDWASTAPKWETVKIDVGSYTVLETNFTLNSIQFKMELVEHNLQRP